LFAGDVIATVGIALSTVKEFEVAATTGLPARSAQAPAPTVMVGVPLPVQPLKVTRALLVPVTAVDFVQVPLSTVIAELMVAPERAEALRSSKVRVKLVVREEETDATRGAEIVTVGEVTSTVNSLVDVAVALPSVMEAVTEWLPALKPVVSMVPLKVEPLQVPLPVIAPLSTLMVTAPFTALQVP
jgi:hypothetical protein